MFKHLDLRSGELEGATIRGIGSDFKQTIGNRKTAFFHFGSKMVEAKKIFLVESPIDALSLREIAPVRSGVYLSTAGSPSVELLGLLPTNSEIVLGFDRDRAGRRFREAFEGVLRSSNRPYQIMIPSLGKDWNEELVRLRTTASGCQTFLPHGGANSKQITKRKVISL